MRGTTVLPALAAAAALLLPSPARAITGGALDGDGHPSVVALVADLPDEGRVPLCSGVLVAPAVVVTAAHCVAWLPDVGVDQVYVTGASSLDPLGAVTPGTPVADPAFGHDAADPHDLAVVLLGLPMAGIAPASLPPADLLDTAHGGLFTNVGYGYSQRLVGSGPPTFSYDGLRRVSTSPFAALTKSMLKLQGNGEATGFGGTCFGDSGGPAFLGTSSVAVGVTSGGSQACAGPSTAYRLDTGSARGFLGHFVTLP